MPARPDEGGGSGGGGGGWRAGPRLDFGCRHVPGDAGSIDESARRLSHEELAVAGRLATEGHVVVALPEEPGRRRRPDLAVCAGTAEVKTVRPRQPGTGHAPSAKTVRNKLVQAMGQSDTVIVHAAGSGLPPSAGREGVRLFSERARQGGIRAVRVVGDGYDLSFRCAPVRRRQPQPPRLERGQAPPRAQPPGLGL